MTAALAIALLLAAPSAHKARPRPALMPLDLYAADGAMLVSCERDEVGNISDCALIGKPQIALNSLVQLMLDQPKNARMAKVVRVRGNPDFGPLPPEFPPRRRGLIAMLLVGLISSGIGSLWQIQTAVFSKRISVAMFVAKVGVGVILWVAIWPLIHAILTLMDTGTVRWGDLL